mmetsp:Transcript_38164/g.151283  ORF Transcript_38164/g.151283 Transcript_38164/m.151283 type:complete len:115 (-) Transcript_38164:110-454(-)
MRGCQKVSWICIRINTGPIECLWIAMGEDESINSQYSPAGDRRLEQRWCVVVAVHEDENEENMMAKGKRGVLEVMEDVFLKVDLRTGAMCFGPMPVGPNVAQYFKDPALNKGRR